MTDRRGRWQKTVAVAAVLAAALTAGARRADASTIGVTSANALYNTGQLDWGVLGPSFTGVPDGFSTPVPGIGGLTITGTQAGGGDFERVDQGPLDWNGNFAPGEELLWSLFSGPMTFTFNAAITGFGLQIAADDFGTFAARIEAFDVSNASLGFFTTSGVASNAGDDSAPFLGLLSNTADIRRVTLSLTTSGNGAGDPTDFAISSPVIQAEPVPEPATLVLFGSAVAGVVARRRSRVSAHRLSKSRSVSVCRNTSRSAIS